MQGTANRGKGSGALAVRRPQITTRFDLKDDDLYSLACAAENELRTAANAQSVWHPEREHFVTFATIGKKIVAIATWSEYDGDAFIGTAWTAPAFRRQGLYRSLVVAIQAEAAKRGLAVVSACASGSNAIAILAHRAIFGVEARSQFELRANPCPLNPNPCSPESSRG